MPAVGTGYQRMRKARVTCSSQGAGTRAFAVSRGEPDERLAGVLA